MNAQLASELIVETPEGVRFRRLLASPLSRALALIIDWMAMILLLIALSLIVQLIILGTGFLLQDLAGAIFYLAAGVILLGYFIILELRWRGQTIGKRVMRLRVIDLEGLRLQPSQLIVRNLVRWADAIFIFFAFYALPEALGILVFPLLHGLGGMVALLSSRGQRLGDIAAGTIVVHEPKLEPAAVADATAGKYNSFREHPHLENLLRKKASPQAVEIAAEALLRRDRLEPSARLKLFAELAEYFRGLVSFPEEVASVLSDERYVRNAVDSFYRRQTREAVGALSA